MVGWPETCLACLILNFEFWIEIYAGGHFPLGENLTGVVPSSLLSEEELEKPWTGALDCRKPFDFLKENSYSDAAVYMINVETC